jgi:hypothetical protein
MLIHVAEKHAAGPGKKVATVVTTDGARLECWPEQLANLDIGGRYEVEVKDREFNGRTYRRIAKVSPVNGIAASIAKPAPTTNGSGNSYRRTDPVDSERMFVCASLTAFIRSGKIEPELGKVTNAIQVLRSAYRRTFGADDRIFSPGEVGRRHQDAE